MRKATPQAVAIAGRLHEWLETYLPSLKAVSIHSQRSYKTALSLYVEYLESERRITPSNLDGSCLSKDAIEKWILWLKEKRKCTPATCNLRLSALRSFLKYISDCDISYLETYLQSCTVPCQKTTKKKVEGLSKEAVGALLKAPDSKKEKGFRDIVIMMLLYTCALRVDELLSLKLSNIDIDGSRPSLTVIGKGRKIRTLPLLARPVQYLRKYIDCHPGKGKHDSYLFFSASKGFSVPMTSRNVDKLLKSYAMTANKSCADVPLSLHAHQFRHAKASHWLENGMNIAQISHLLGHACIQTTMVYLDITTEQENKALETLENENQKNLPKKWKTLKSGKLAEFLGLD